MASSQACHVTAKKISAFQDGVQDLERVRQELNSNVSAANAWGITAVMANLTIIPLNAVVNSLPAPKAGSIVQRLGTILYSRYGQSGTRSDGSAKQASDAVSLFRDVINAELKKEKLLHYVPGVNIITGAVQDSLAAWQSVEMIAAGDREMRQLQQTLQGNLAKMKKALKDLQTVYDQDCTQLPALSSTPMT